MLTIQELYAKLGSVAKSLEDGCTWEMLAAPASRFHICKEATRRLESTRKYFTQDASSYVTKELWAVL